LCRCRSAFFPKSTTIEYVKEGEEEMGRGKEKEPSTTTSSPSRDTLEPRTALEL
jgi:hypothetical protein